MNEKRLRLIKVGQEKSGPVLYWMQRDQRANDNWALLYAQEKAIEKNVPLIVVFNLVPEFFEATIRQYGFMIKGLREVENNLIKKNIPFILLSGNPVENIPKFIEVNNISKIITDFNPLNIIKYWKSQIASKIEIFFYEVDAHNIVPCWVASDKQEFAAYTFRPKINRSLPEFMEEFPPVMKMKNTFIHEKVNWDSLISKLKINFNITEVKWLKPGESAAHKTLDAFLKTKFERYGTERNFPDNDVQSNLSPYFHFGHIAPQRAALIISHLTGVAESQKAFLEEMIVRRELADNFCYYNSNYDSFDGFPNWAKESLNKHRKDKREFVYSLDEFENACTHDELWNAAQIEMVNKGKMHGYMRMYWAKKILEWTESPEEAIKTAIYLNNKYELDGRDPNGYTGIAWSIGGVHDRAWTERNVYGKIRYMNYAGCKRKFDINKYTMKNSS